MQADATLLANNSRHSGMLHVASVSHPVACCYMFLRVVGSGCAKVESGQTFGPANSQHFFCSVVAVAWDQKTMLDPFAQLFQHCCGHARALHMVSKDLWVVSFPRCSAGPNIVGNCCVRLHTTTNTNATTPNIVGTTMLGVVTSVCT